MFGGLRAGCVDQKPLVQIVGVQIVIPHFDAGKTRLESREQRTYDIEIGAGMDVDDTRPSRARDDVGIFRGITGGYTRRRSSKR